MNYPTGLHSSAPAAALALGVIGNCAASALDRSQGRIVRSCRPRFALARNGGHVEARATCEAMLAARNPLGLLSEYTHPITGEMRGNFSQTQSLVGLINGAVRLSEPSDTVI